EPAHVGHKCQGDPGAHSPARDGHDSGRALSGGRAARPGPRRAGDGGAWMTGGRVVAMVLAAVGAAVVGILTLGRRRGAIIPCLFPIFVDGVLARRAPSCATSGPT